MKRLLTDVTFNARLAAKGWEHIGSGLSATVWAIPHTDKCLKVGRKDSWPAYIHWAIAHGYAGTFAPRVDSIKLIRNRFYVAVMERLVCTVRHSIDPKVKQLYSNFCNNPHRSECSHAMLQFRKNVIDAGFNYDWHENNFMLRNDGTMVLIDPMGSMYRDNINYSQKKSTRALSPIQPEV